MRYSEHLHEIRKPSVAGGGSVRHCCRVVRQGSRKVPHAGSSTVSASVRSSHRIVVDVENVVIGNGGSSVPLYSSAFSKSPSVSGQAWCPLRSDCLSTTHLIAVHGRKEPGPKAVSLAEKIQLQLDLRHRVTT